MIVCNIIYLKNRPIECCCIWYTRQIRVLLHMFSVSMLSLKCASVFYIQRGCQSDFFVGINCTFGSFQAHLFSRCFVVFHMMIHRKKKKTSIITCSQKLLLNQSKSDCKWMISVAIKNMPIVICTHRWNAFVAVCFTRKHSSIAINVHEGGFHLMCVSVFFFSCFVIRK